MAEPNYKDEYSRFLEKNWSEFDINNVDVKNKVKRFCSKFNFDEDEVFEKIKENKFLKAWFIKDPAKQNVYETTFENFLRKMNNVYDLEKLPTSGPRSVFIINQEVRTKAHAGKQITSQAKSMDFHFRYKNLSPDFYVFHKYTKEPGGAQDNQKNDVINAIDKASAAHLEDSIYVLFVCDGDYYKNNKILEEIDAHINNKNFKLLNSSQIEDFLNSLLI